MKDFKLTSQQEIRAARQTDSKKDGMNESLHASQTVSKNDLAGGKTASDLASQIAGLPEIMLASLPDCL